MPAEAEQAPEAVEAEPPAAVEAEEAPEVVSSHEELANGDTSPQRAADGVRSFAGELLAPLFAAEGNVVVSPYSVTTAMHLAMLGASGETLTQLQEGLSSSAETGHADIGALTAALASDDEGAPTVRVANRIWVERSQEENLVPTYRERSAEWYGAGAGFVDFLGAPEDARASINAWVSEQTEAMIPELLSQGSVDASTRAVLTNAVYFLGSWASGFDEDFTTEGPFFTPDAEPSTVRFMTKQADMRYLSREDRQVVGLPYRGFDWALYVVLPAPGELESVGRSLAASGFASGMPRSTERVDLHLPRFRAAWTGSLKDPLRALGMTLPFSREGADFAEMFADNGVYVDDVIHEAVIEVDETGTEAAAATGVVMVTRSAPRPRQPVLMRVDRPSYFVLMHEPTETPLFVGRVNAPEALD